MQISVPAAKLTASCPKGNQTMRTLSALMVGLLLMIGILLMAGCNPIARTDMNIDARGLNTGESATVFIVGANSDDVREFDELSADDFFSGKRDSDRQLWIDEGRAVRKLVDSSGTVTISKNDPAWNRWDKQKVDVLYVYGSLIGVNSRKSIRVRGEDTSYRSITVTVKSDTISVTSTR